MTGGGGFLNMLVEKKWWIIGGIAIVALIIILISMGVLSTKTSSSFLNAHYMPDPGIPSKIPIEDGMMRHTRQEYRTKAGALGRNGVDSLLRTSLR